MAFNADFSITQDSDLSSVTLVDTSTGTDPNLTGRRIYPYQDDGNLLLPPNTSNYIDWPIADSSITVSDLLPKDYALSVNVVWLSSSPLPSPSTYNKTVIFGATKYLQDFIYDRVQDISANNAIINDQQYYESLSKLQTEKDNVDLSVLYESVTNAQAALNRAQQIMNNQSKYF